MVTSILFITILSQQPCIKEFLGQSYPVSAQVYTFDSQYIVIK
jgi:hypothetical protein